jgi:NAD(P)-dependent dehydrogenase (short-subunit alcohol dehydrogenase family)
MGEESLKGFGPSSMSPNVSNHKDVSSRPAPIGRAGQPIEVATPFVFLASADSSYFTAQVSLGPLLYSLTESDDIVLPRQWR